MSNTNPSLMKTAVEAYQAGLCPLPVATDGSKRPGLSSWSEYQDHLPDMTQLLGWFGPKGYDGWGTVCGRVAGRLICVDIEGGFTDRFVEMSKRLEGAGLLDDFEAAMQGYTETTPNDGVHILVRLMGDGPTPGNTKIALASDHSTLIETRGEGGFVILAPSQGRTHPSGKPWILRKGGVDTIHYWDEEVYEAIVHLLRSFDETPPTPPPPPPINRQLRVAGEGWIEQALAQVPDLASVLVGLGWTYTRDDALGQLWRRPGKSFGVSGRINLNGRLMVFSTSTPLPTGLTTYDALDVIMTYELGRVPNRDERTEYLRRYRQELPIYFPPDVHEEEEPDDEPAPAPDSKLLYLPDSFWQSTTLLTQLYEDSLRYLNSPDGVFGALEALYAMTIPMNYWIPPIVGAPAPLNLFSVLVAGPGGGKTTAMTAAAQMLRLPPNPDWNYGSLRSGEGLITMARKPPKKENGELLPQAYNTGIHVSFDEGGGFSAQQERSGQTAIPYLNTAWSGAGKVGGSKAEGEISFPANLVRVCATIGVQYGLASNLFTGEIARMGFPQRITFFGLDHPERRNQRRQLIEEVPALGVQEWKQIGGRTYLPFSDAICDEVWNWTQTKGDRADEGPYDGHMMNLRLRHAAVLAMMHNRTNELDFFWALAGQILATSQDGRDSLLRSFATVNRQQNLGRGAARGEQSEGERTYHVDRVARRLAVKMASVDSEGITRKELKNWAGRDKQYLAEAFDLATLRRQVVHRGGKYYPK